MRHAHPSVFFLKLGIAFLLMPWGGTLATAQGPDGGGLARSIGTPAGVNYVMVLMAPAVQTELKLSDEQKARVFDLARESQQKGRERLQMMLQSGNPQAFLAAGLQIRKENEAAAGRILKTEQKERMEQIMLQIEGPLAVVHPEIAEKLNMTAKQNQQAQVTLIQMAQQVRMMMIEQARANAQAGGGFLTLGPAGLPREAMNEVRNAATRQLGRILDPKQKFNFNKMLGAPFDLAKIDPELAERRGVAASPDISADSSSSASRTEKSRARRKGAASSKTATTKPAEPEDTPKP